MVGKRFYRPAAITGWVVVIYGGQQRFNSSAADNMVNGLLTSFDEVGTYSCYLRAIFAIHFPFVTKEFVVTIKSL